MKIHKTVCLLAAVCAAAPCLAQKWPAGGKKAVQAARASVKTMVSRKVSGLVPRATNFSVPAAALERYVFKTVAPTPAGRLVLRYDDAPYSWILESASEYAWVARRFKAFKKEADAFLYYQTNLSESRLLHAEEISYWRKRIDAMAADLDAVRLRVDSDDPLLSFAQEYLTYARWVIFPHAKDIYFITPLAPRTDRTFSMQEFFLQNPAAESFRWELPFSRVRRVSAQLPPGLRVAVVNDFRLFRERVGELHRQGRLFPDGSLETYSKADDLLEDMIKGGKKYDVIFTDIIIFGGGGGYYLASELRRQGYGGVIISLSSYPQSEELGRKMFERGIDGMIRLEGGAEYKRGWPADVMQKLLNHYYYRDVGGWSR